MLTNIPKESRPWKESFFVNYKNKRYRVASIDNYNFMFLLKSPHMNEEMDMGFWIRAETVKIDYN